MVACCCLSHLSWSIQHPRPNKQVFVIEFKTASSRCKELHSGLASHHNVLSRATEKALTIFVRLSFENRHDEDESFESAQRSDERKGIARSHSFSCLSTAEELFRTFLWGRPDLPDRILDNRA